MALNGIKKTLICYSTFGTINKNEHGKNHT